jgi:hypothetical protein
MFFIIILNFRLNEGELQEFKRLHCEDTIKVDKTFAFQSKCQELAYCTDGDHFLINKLLYPILRLFILLICFS